MTGGERTRTVAALGAAQTIAWASSYYLPAMLAAPMARDLGVSVPVVFAAFSASLIVSALIGPHSGRAIDRWGGRPVLMATNVVFAIGLLGLATSTGPVGLFVAWLIMGLGMGSGLYEAAFAALVRLYGRDSRNVITGITLIAGFASTVGWPLTTLLEAQFGWRSACVAWALMHVVMALPLNWSLPRARATGRSAQSTQSVQSAQSVESTHGADATVDDTEHRPGSAAAIVLAFVFAATWFVSTAMAAHLPRLLQETGMTLAGAVAVGALVGPAQVAGRLLEFGFLRRLHPLLSARLAALMHPAGVAVVAIAGPPAAAAFGVLHGLGNGILTIAKGTLPLVFFGPQGYGHRQGVLMVPARFAQALSPWIFGIVLDRWGAGALALSATLGLLAAAALWALPKPREGTQSAAAV